MKVKVPSRLYAITDGSGGRRVDYLSVQKGYIALFLSLGLDELIACRTAAGQLYWNPVERMHAIGNKGLQSVGMMREKMDSNMEKLIKNANTNSEINVLCEAKSELKIALQKSIDSPINLLETVFCQLSWKGKEFKIYN